MHAGRLGRWLTTHAVAAGGNSFDYFVQRYGTLTWVVSRSPLQVPCFSCGNVTGGGMSPLELNANEYNSRALADALEQPEVARLHVFHGGWHDGLSWAFDPSVTDDTGERLIVRFSELEVDLDDPPRRGAVVKPFGFWLFERVETLTAAMMPILATLQA